MHPGNVAVFAMRLYWMLCPLIIQLHLTKAEDEERIQQLAGLTVDLAHTLHCGCVVLLQDLLEPRLIMTTSAVRLQERLSAANLPTSALSLKQFAKVRHLLRCKARQLFVILSITLQTHYFLAQISQSKKWGLTSNLVFHRKLNNKPRHPVWLLAEEFKYMDSFLRHVYIPYDCEFIIIEWQEQGILLTEVYRIRLNSSLIRSQLGLWRGPGELDINKRALYHRRNNMHGVVLTAAVRDNYPFISLGPDIKNTPPEGFVWSVWVDLMHNLNFTVSLVDVRNLTQQGLQFLLVRHEVDMGLDQVALSMFWFHLISFTVPVQTSRFRLYIRYQGSESLDSSAYIAPFSQELWLATGGVIILTALCLALTAEDPVARLQSPFVALGIYCMQGQTWDRLKASGKITLLVSFLSAVVLVNMYSGQLVAFLASRKPHLPFTDVEGLSLNRKYRLQVVWGSPEHNIMTNSYNPVLSRFMDDVEVRNNSWFPTSYWVSLQVLCFNKVVALLLEDYAIAYSHRMPCDIVFLPDFAMRSAMAFPFTKNSPWLGIINYKLGAMRQAGLLQRQLLVSRWQSPVIPEEGITSVTVQQTGAIFSLLAFGIVLAVVVLVLERRYHSKKIRHKLIRRKRRMKVGWR